ncbi:unnamed protein product [Caenorhabditis angaria]|uniref:Serpentine receptor class gamma n=1 Tax=Caenorhabditis angaria TaxID=860376 RepID=A0A9P1ISS4_9PELO|nr:unnamed protein product [Caenorhabditis angaria]
MFNSENNTCAPSHFAYFIFQTLYMLPFVLIYLKFTYRVIFKNNEKYSDAFFTIYLVDGVSNLFYILGDFAIPRAMAYIDIYCEFMMRHFTKPTYFLTPHFFFYMFFQFMKSFSLVLLCLNRYTSVVKPLEHKHFWKRHLHKLIIAQIILSVFFSSPTLTGPAYTQISISYVQVVYVHNIPYIRTSLFRIITIIPSIAFIVISNIILMSKLSKVTENMRKLIITTIIMSISQILTLMTFLLVYYVPAQFWLNYPNLSAAYLLLSQITKDVDMISGTLCLLVLDGRIRSTIFLT